MKKPGWFKPEPTVLLVDIKDEFDVILTDHLWFNYTKGFQDLGKLKPGDQIEFDARVAKYEKGYKGRDEFLQLSRPVETDYHLSYPTKLKKIS